MLSLDFKQLVGEGHIPEDKHSLTRQPLPLSFYRSYPGVPFSTQPEQQLYDIVTVILLFLPHRKNAY
jgi:hypothetical protein